MRKVLSIAEKPSIAKHLMEALKSTWATSITLHPSQSQYNPVYVLKGQFKGEPAEIYVTSVTGHIWNKEFHERYKSWEEVDPLVLLTAGEIVTKHTESSKNIIRNLEKLAGVATDLFLWLDCDREGESIAYEVIEVCSGVNKALNIHRAKFSSVTHKHLLEAFKHPGAPNPNLNEAVLARQELDLRSGSAFTRLQTSLIKKSFPNILRSVYASFGTCQFPTLNFVVERFLRNNTFDKKSFWALCLKVEKAGSVVELNWGRSKLFDKEVVSILHEFAGSLATTARVVAVDRKQQKRSKPMPLTTVDLQKLSSNKLKLSSDDTMKIAEQLYTKGYISYPRTETDSFDSTFDFFGVIKTLSKINAFKGFGGKLLGREMFQKPRAGKRDDKAHPPIHPVKEYDVEENTPESQVYDLISRHFLASCAKDAVIEVSTVGVLFGSEQFHANGLVLVEPNFLEIYSPFYALQSQTIPSFEPDEVLKVKEFSVKEGSTSPPKLLSEAELISLMDKHRIGTDSTMHEHIKTIQERNYAVKKRGVFRPTQLGIAMLQAYKKIDIALADPANRASLEANLALIAEGETTRARVIEESLNEWIQNYNQLVSRKQEFLAHFKEVFEAHYELSKMEIEEQVDDEQSDRLTRSYAISHHHCSVCAAGHSVLRQSKSGIFFVGCSNFPKCGNSSFFTSKLVRISKSPSACSGCGAAAFIGVGSGKEAKEAVFCLSASECPSSYRHLLNGQLPAKSWRSGNYKRKYEVRS